MLLNSRSVFLANMNSSRSHLSFPFIVLFILIGLFGSTQSFAQSKSSLEKQKQDLLQKINDAEQILKQTKNKKEASIGQLNALNKKIEAQEALVKNIKSELSLLDKQIDDMDIIIGALESDLQNLKKEYAAMLYAAQKSDQSISRLMFLFSASSFNELWMRLKYMEYYGKAREKQVKEIQEVRKTLINQQEAVRKKKSEKKSLLDEQLSRNQELVSSKESQKQLVEKLASREKEIKADLAERKKAVNNLNKLIADLVRKEMEKNKAAEKKTGMPATPASAALSNSFAENKTKLPWPVKSGFISQHFGRHPHPIYKNITLQNDGVDIQTQQGEAVQAVFSGTVKAVAFVPGMNNVVILQHGNYFTLYARLKKVEVHSGQKIEAKQTIGNVLTDSHGVSELQFQIWKNDQKLDPEDWLAHK